MRLSSQAAFAAALTGRQTGGDPRGLTVHRNNRKTALIDSLAATFPACARIVGTDFFAQMAGDFIASYPPVSPVLHEYGADFAAFVGNYDGVAALSYLADVAQLEWAWMCAYHAGYAAPLAADALAGHDDDTLLGATIRLHPSFGLIRSAYPVGTIWQMNCEGGTPAAIADWRGECVAVLRPHLAVTVQSLGADAADFLAALGRGLCLGEAIALTAARHPGFDPALHLAGVFALGAVAALTPNHPKE